jgi:hypothetical protein
MNITITIDGTDPKKAFAAGAFWNEFQRECGKCGKCGCTEILPTHRKNQGYDFYEAVCTKCNARYSFGQKKEDQSLFPKRDKGWQSFSKDGGEKQQQSFPSTDDDGDESPPF